MRKGLYNIKKSEEKWQKFMIQTDRQIRFLSTLNKFTMLSIYYVFYNKHSISQYNMMTNYKTKKAAEDPRIALWPENLGKN